jgi:uncharacterized membrane protein
MQGIYTYMTETNHVPKQYNVTAILSLLFMVPISLAAALVLMYFIIIIIIIIIIIVVVVIVISGTAAQRGLWPLRLRGFLITHNEAPQSVGLR